MIGLYFHIPFCVKKCFYCAFSSIPQTDYTDSFANRYIYALCKEMSVNSANEDGKPKVDTVFFGGGTPSLLEPAAVDYIYQHAKKYFDISGETEFSIEANPGTIGEDKLRAYRNLGVNRISIGGQTFSNEHLHKLGRIHTCEELDYALKTAIKMDFNSVNLDLIFGFPGQTFDSFKHDLKKIAGYNLQHLSLYMFTPEDGTPLGDSVLSDEETIPSDEELADMMNFAHDFLTKEGYNHYELSNYCIDGYECRHNLKYWKYSEYRGFGASACSFRRRFRYKNISDPHDYVYKTEHNFLPFESGECLSQERAIGEYVILALRTAKGIAENEFRCIFGVDFNLYYENILEELVAGGFLGHQNGFWYIPFKHFPIQSEICGKFI